MANLPFEFRYRQEKPVSPGAGCFYWVKNGNKIWFSPDNNPDHMVLLSNEVSEDLIGRLEGDEANIERIQEQLSEISDRIVALGGDVGLIQETLENLDLNSFVTQSTLDDYVTDDELEDRLRDISSDVELDDSDYDIIAAKVKFTWQIIK